MHTFVYSRVSTASQTTENQTLEIEQAGYKADTVYEEQISGKVPASDRPEFANMLDAIVRTRRPKRLIVTKLDRLGRDAGDIMQTVMTLRSIDCGVRVLQFGDIDLASPGGKIVLATLSAVAEVERDILIERTLAGLQRARNEGKKLGRPRVTDESKRRAIRAELAENTPVAQIAKKFGVSRMTVMRVRDAA